MIIIYNANKQEKQREPAACRFPLYEIHYQKVSSESCSNVLLPHPVFESILLCLIVFHHEVQRVP